MRDCAKCGKPVDGASCPFCGYSDQPSTEQPKVRPADWWQCVHEDRGQRCSNPGSVSPSILGQTKAGKHVSGPWYCPTHLPTLRRMNAHGVVCPPPMGFDGLRKAARGKPYDFEATAERLAMQQPEP